MVVVKQWDVTMRESTSHASKINYSRLAHTVYELARPFAYTL